MDSPREDRDTLNVIPLQDLRFGLHDVDTDVQSRADSLSAESQVDASLLESITPQHSNIPKPSHPGFRLRRYWWRGSVGLLGPFVIAVYYLITWRLYLLPSKSLDGALFGRSGSQLVFYSWFLLAVVGLDIGEYGLAGVEASMLMSTYWAAPNASKLMSHGDRTWAGIGGWISNFKKLIRKREKATFSDRLWIILAVLSACLLTGLPLTGLTMEITNGFISSSSSPVVVGLDWDSFTQRDPQTTLMDTYPFWIRNIPPRIPGRGIIYVNQTMTPLLRQMPIDSGTGNIFLAPQADTPMSGTFWGLMLRYSCTIVDDINQFTILNHRKNLTSAMIGDAGYGYYDVPGIPNAQIEARVRTYNNTFMNYFAISEFAQVSKKSAPSVFEDNNAWDCYFPDDVDEDGNLLIYPGLEVDSKFELALWQYARIPNVETLDRSIYNFTIDQPVGGLRGAYSLFLNRSTTLTPLESIGVQCSSSSALGYAQLDGITGTYSNFSRSASPPSMFGNWPCPYRLSRTVSQLLFTTSGDSANQGDWTPNFFYSMGITSRGFSNTTSQAAQSHERSSYNIRTNLLQAADLRHSMLRAFGTAAVQLAYNGSEGYPFSNFKPSAYFINPNATAYRPGRILTSGPVPPVVPATLMLIWCIGSLILAFRYGFERRWSGTLDSSSLYRFGADPAQQLQATYVFANSVALTSKELMRLPGLIGDSEPAVSPGHITLVTDGYAKKNKRYI